MYNICTIVLLYIVRVKILFKMKKLSGKLK